MNALRRTIFAAAFTALAGFASAQESAPLTALDYKVVGTSLNVTPAVLSVPKGIAVSISAKLSGGAVPPAGSILEAMLRGPSFPALSSSRSGVTGSTRTNFSQRPPRTGPLGSSSKKGARSRQVYRTAWRYSPSRTRFKPSVGWPDSTGLGSRFLSVR